MRFPGSVAPLLLGAAAVALSCGNPTPTGIDRLGPAALGSVSTVADGPASRDAVKTVAQHTGLLRCPQATAAAESLTVGPKGGTLAAGPDVLLIPPGALADTVTITLEALSDTLRAVRLRPEGLVFQQPVYVVMSYANCQTFGSKAEKRVAYTSDAFVILEYEPSVDDHLVKQVIGQLSHFSNYAVAW